MDYDDSAAETDSLSLPLAVLGDLSARERFHQSQDAVARMMRALAAQAAELARCDPASTR